MMDEQHGNMLVLNSPDYFELHCESFGSTQSLGWSSPRISFSTDFISIQADKELSASQKWDDDVCFPSDFEFSMLPTSAVDPLAEGYMVTADELFHMGKLLPGYIPPRTVKEIATVEAPQQREEPKVIAHTSWSSADNSSLTMASHLNAESLVSASSPPTCCSLAPPGSLRSPKAPKWRELFGALRRVKSDSGRHRVIEEPFLPPTKSSAPGKRFFRHFFRGGSGHHDTKSSSYFADISSSTAYSSYTTAPPVPSSTLEKIPFSDPQASASTPASSRERSVVRLVHDTATVNKATQVAIDATGANLGRSEPKPIIVRKTSGKCMEGLTALKTRSPGKNSPVRVPLRKIDKVPSTVGNLVRSGSGRYVVRNFERVATGGKSFQSLQEQTRALRSREIRRSPDRSVYTSSVRVMPVLNVPVCMGPVLRGSGKSGSGRLYNFRNMLSFNREKLLTSYATPIASQ